MSRRWPETLLCAAGALALLAWSASLFRSTALGGAAAAVVGLAIGALAVMGPASGPCPLCGATLHGLFAVRVTELERCPHCRRYFLVSGGSEVASDFVAPSPLFSVPVDRGERLPGLCCVCAAPATRSKEVAHRSEGRVSHASPVATRSTVAVPVPFCAAHDGEVAIVNEDLAPSKPLLQGGGEPDHRWVLKVRSYAFYRAAVGV